MLTVHHSLGLFRFGAVKEPKYCLSFEFVHSGERINSSDSLLVFLYTTWVERQWGRKVSCQRKQLNINLICSQGKKYPVFCSLIMFTEQNWGDLVNWTDLQWFMVSIHVSHQDDDQIKLVSATVKRYFIPEFVPSSFRFALQRTKESTRPKPLF